MKDKLIELLNDATFGVNVHTLADHLKRETIEAVADHLLAAGVIVPPCKVGDRVYMLCEDFGSIFQCQIRSMNYVDGMWQGKLRNTWVHALGNTYDWVETEFGTDIFLTQEEAEKALKERSKE